jgi:hypothetical protein
VLTFTVESEDIHIEAIRGLNVLLNPILNLDSSSDIFTAVPIKINGSPLAGGILPDSLSPGTYHITYRTTRSYPSDKPFFLSRKVCRYVLYGGRQS